MASRWMAAKLIKLAKQRRRDPVAVTHTRPGHTIEAANRLQDELGSMVARFKGEKVTAPTGHRLRAIGKQRREFDGRTFGNGTRRLGGSGEYYSLWSTEDRLIKA